LYNLGSMMKLNLGGPQHKTHTKTYWENPDSPMGLSTHDVIHIFYFILMNKINFNEEGYYHINVLKILFFNNNSYFFECVTILVHIILNVLKMFYIVRSLCLES